MQILYEMDTTDSMDHETAARLAEERLTGNNRERGLLLLRNIIDQLEAIDADINAKSRSWKTSRKVWHFSSG